MKYAATLVLMASAAAANPTDLKTAFDRLSEAPVTTTGTLQFNGELWIDTDTEERIGVTLAAGRETIEAAEACEWPDGCRVTLTGTLRVRFGLLDLLAEDVMFHD